MIYIFSFTENGDRLNKTLSKGLDGEKRSFCRSEASGRLSELTRSAFECADAIIFIGAAGIAVRAVSPYITDKTEDPAVLVCDEGGRFVIPILSGHIGGANELAVKTAALTGACPVITTATDINGVFAADVWAVKQGFAIHDPEEIKHISSALLRGEKIGFASDIHLDPELPEALKETDNNAENGILVSPFLKKPYPHTLNLIPRVISAGAGSKKNADAAALVGLYERVMRDNRISPSAIKNIATIDIKKGERAITELCRHTGTEPVYYSAEELNEVQGSFTSSDLVKAVTGTDSVCERCAVRASGGGRLIVRKTLGSGVTLALAASGLKEGSEEF